MIHSRTEADTSDLQFRAPGESLLPACSERPGEEEILVRVTEYLVGSGLSDLM